MSWLQYVSFYFILQPYTHIATNIRDRKQMGKRQIVVPPLYFPTPNWITEVVLETKIIRNLYNSWIHYSETARI